MRSVLEALEALKRAMFQGARPEAAVGAFLALIIGVIGFAIAMALVVAYLRDLWFVAQAEKARRRPFPPRFGPLAMSLGTFLATPVGRSVLSPDAAAEFVSERLETQQEFLLSFVRFFSYTPLLLGLTGTILALRGLLVDSGKTLQEIQPDLAGVFGGTLAGIVGSLVAAIGMVALETAARWVNTRTQDLIHLRVLPDIPDRRISLQIEDAILERIGAKAEGVALALQSALQPLATNLSSAAAAAAKAATVAIDAFTLAAEAVRGAGDLEKIMRGVKSTAHMLDSSSDSLADATRQTAETLLKFADIHSAANATATGLEQASVTLAAAGREMSSALGSRMQSLEVQSAALDASVRSIASTFERSSERFTLQSQLDLANAAAIKIQSEQVERAMQSVSKVATEVTPKLVALAEGSFEVHRRVADELGRLTSVASSNARSQVDEPVETMVASLAGLARELKAVTEQILRQPGGAGTPPSEAIGLLRELSQQVKVLAQSVGEAADIVRAIRIETAESQKPHSDKPAVAPASGFFRGLFRRKAR